MSFHCVRRITRRLATRRQTLLHNYTSDRCFGHHRQCRWGPRIGPYASVCLCVCMWKQLTPIDEYEKLFLSADTSASNESSKHVAARTADGRNCEFQLFAINRRARTTAAPCFDNDECTHVSARTRRAGEGSADENGQQQQQQQQMRGTERCIASIYYLRLCFVAVRASVSSQNISKSYERILIKFFRGVVKR